MDPPHGRLLDNGAANSGPYTKSAWALNVTLHVAKSIGIPKGKAERLP